MLASSRQRVIQKNSIGFKLLICAKHLTMYNPLAKMIVTCSKIEISSELSQLQENGENKTVSCFYRSLQEFKKIKRS